MLKLKSQSWRPRTLRTSSQQQDLYLQYDADGPFVFNGLSPIGQNQKGFGSGEEVAGMRLHRANAKRVVFPQREKVRTALHCCVVLKQGPLMSFEYRSLV